MASDPVCGFTEGVAQQLVNGIGGTPQEINSGKRPPPHFLRFYRFTMNEAWGATTSTAADSDILEMDGTDTNTDSDVYDPLGIFADMTTGDAGICFYQDGKYWAIQADCGSA